MARKNKIMQMLVIYIMMLVYVAGCGSNSEEALSETTSPIETAAQVAETTEAKEDIPETEEDALDVVEEETEEIEVVEMLPYAEEHGLEFCKDTEVTIKGTRSNPDNEEDIEQIDAEWVLKSIEVSDAEDGFQTITIRHECTGYLWTDHKSRALFNISLPSAGYFDLYTGKCFPTFSMSEGGEIGNQTEVEWDGQTYEVSYTQVAEWDDGTEWTPDGKGGYTLPSTLCITDTVVVKEGYEGLGMVVYPITIEDAENKTNGVNDGKEYFIEEVLEKNDGSVIFDVMDIYTILEGEAEISDAGSINNEGDVAAGAENPKESKTDNSNAPAGNTASKQEDTKPQQKPHTHDYASSVIKNPSCTETGIKTYTCSCGDSYTEEIAASGHQWTATTETISHPSTGHYETVTRKEAFCGCGFTCTSQAELTAHKENDGCGYYYGGVREYTDNEWVVDSESWEETITTNRCTICGISQ